MSNKTAQRNLHKNTEHNTTEKTVLSVSEAAAILKISPTSLRRLEQENRIKSFRQPNGYRMFNNIEVLNLKATLDEEKKVKHPKAFVVEAAPVIETKAAPVMAEVAAPVATPVEVPATAPVVEPVKPVEVKVQPVQETVTQPTKPIFTPIVINKNVKHIELGKEIFKELKTIKKPAIYGAIAGVLLVSTFVVASLKFNKDILGKATIGNFLGFNTSNKPTASLGNVLSDKDLNSDFVFKINIPAILKENTTIEKDLAVNGSLSVGQLATLSGGLTTNNQNGDFGTGTITTGIVNFVGTASLNNLAAIDTVTKATLEKSLDIAGDVTSTGMSNTVVTAINGAELGDTKTTADNILMVVGGKWTSVSQTEITSLGTITQGVWEGDPIAPEFGGLGISSFVAGDLIFADTNSTWNTLNIGGTGYILTSNNGLPAWASPSSLLGDAWLLTGNTNTNPNVNYIGTNDNNGLSLRTNSVDRLRITDNGFIGIGNTNPAVEVHLGNGSTTPTYIAGVPESQYIEGDLEVAGTIYGSLIGVITTTGFDPNGIFFADATGTMVNDNTQITWNPTDSNFTVNGTSMFNGLATLSNGLSVTGPFNTSGQVALGNGAGTININGSSITLDDSNLLSAITLTTNPNSSFSSGDTAIVDAINAAYEAATGSGDGLWSVRSGVLYPASTVQDLSVGQSSASAPFFFDTSENILILTNSTAGDSFRVNDQASDVTPFIIDDAGNVGIGTTNPTYKLEIIGDARLSNGSDLYIGTIGLNDGGTSNITSGASLVGVFDEFTWSDGTTVQQVLNDLDAQIFSVAGNSHPAVNLTGTANYLSLNAATQLLTQSAIDLSSANNTTGSLLASRGGLGVDASTAPAGSIILGTGTGLNIRTMGGDATVASNGTLTLSNTGVTAGTYGNGNGIPVIQVDARGRIISASTALANFEQTLTFNNPLSRSGNVISVDIATTGTTATTASNSGLEIAADGMRLIGGCASNEVLAWDGGANRWRCASVSGIGSVTGTGYNGGVTYWNSSSTVAASDNFYWNNTLSRLGIGTTNPQVALHVIGDVNATNLRASTALIVGGTSLSSTSSNRGSGAFMIGVNDEFTNSNNTNVQAVLRDLDVALSNVAGGTGAFALAGQTHPALQLAGTATYLSLNGSQVLTQNAIDLTNVNNLTGALLTSRGGLGVDASTAPVGTLVIGTGTGFNIRAMGGDATIASNGTLALANTGVTAGTYGSVTGIPVIQIDAKGRIISASTSPVTSGIDGVGLANYVARFSDDNTLTFGTLYDNGSQIGLGTTNPSQALDVSGAIRLGAAGIYNVLNTSAAGGVATGNLFWGNSSLVSSSNVSNYAVTSLTAGNGLTLTGTGPGSIALSLDVTTTSNTSTTASNSGLEIASDGLRLIGGCAANEVLSWDAGANRWRCSTVGGIGAITGNGSNGQVTFWNGSSNLTGNDSFFWNNGTASLGLGTTNPGATLAITPANAAALLINAYGSGAGNTGELRFSELTANGTNYTGFKSPDSLAQTIMYTLPASTSPSDYVLTFQTGGSLEWKEITGVGAAGDITQVGSMMSGIAFANSSADNQWLGLGSSAGRIEFDDQATDEVNILDARLGVGTSTPQYTLDVNGDVNGTNIRGTAFIVGGTSLASTSSNRGSGAFMIGAYDEFTNSNSTNVQAVLRDFDAYLGGVAGNTHPAIQLAGAASYLTLDAGTQVLTQTAINVSTAANTTGVLLTSRGGLGVDASTAPAGTLVIGTGTGFNIRAMGGDASLASNGTITLSNTGVTAATYGSALGIPVLQINAAGRIVSASTAAANFEQTLTFSNPLSRVGNTISLDVITTGLTTTTASNSGLEIGSDGLRLLGGCAANEVLSWDAGANRWHCSSITGVGAVDGSGIANFVARFSDNNTLTTGIIYDDGTRVGLGTTNPTEMFSLVAYSNPAISLTNTAYGVTGTLFNDGNVHLTGGGNLWLDGGNIYMNSGNNYGVTVGSTVSNAKIDIKGAGTTNGLAFAIKDSSSVYRFAIQDNGRVGIGTTQPTRELDVVGTIAASTNLMVGGTALSSTTSNRGSGAYMIGAYDEFTNSNSTNVQAVLKDLDTALANVAGGTAAFALAGQTHPALQIAGSATYLSLNGTQVLTQNAIDLTNVNNISGALLTSRGGLGVDASTAPAGTLVIGTGTGLNIRAMGGDATIASNGTLALANTGVTAATYGSSNGIPVIQVDAKGRIISASTALANFEQTLSFSNPLTRSGNTISLDVVTTGTTSTTASNSGLEIGSDGLRLLGGCAANEVLSWDAGANRWRCSSISGVGAVTGSGMNNYIARWTGANTLGTGAIYDNGTQIGIGLTNPLYTLDVAGDVRGTNLRASALIVGGTSLAATTANRASGAYMIGAFDEFTNSNSTNVQFVLKDLDTALNNLAGGTAAFALAGQTHPALQLAGTASYLSLNGTQVLTQSAINLSTAANTAGVLLSSRGGLGVDASTAPAGTLALGTGTGFNIRAMGGDATIASNGTLTLANSGVTAATYGSSNGIPVIQVDAKGRIISASTALANFEQTLSFSNPITRSGNTISLDVTTTSSTSTTASNSGLEIGSDGLRLLGGCALNEVLAWDSGANRWRCSTISGVGAVTGTGQNNYITRWTGTNTLGTGAIYDNGTQIGIGLTNPTYTLDVAGDVRGTNLRGSALIVGGTSLASTSSNRGSGAFMIGAYDEFTNSNSTNVQAVLRDLDAALVNVAGGTAAFALAGQTHPALQLAGTATYLSLNGTQVLTQSAIDLTSTSNTTGALLTSRGGLGVDASTSPAGTIILGTGTGLNIRAMGGDATIASNGTLTLANSGVTAATYGSALGVPVIQVDAKGRIISASTAALVNILDGNGIANYVARFSDTNTLMTGALYDNGTQVGVGTTNPLYTLDIAGDVRGTNLRASALIVGGTSLASTSSNRGSGAFMIGAFDEFTYSNNSTVQAVLKDFDNALSNLAGGTGAYALAGQTHPALQLAGTATYLSLNGSQVLTQGAIDLTSTNNTTGALLTSRGGLGVDASTAPAGSLVIGTGTGFNIRAVGGDATLASNGTFTLSNSGVTAATYGSTLGIPVIQIDAKGRIISASTAAITNMLDGNGIANYVPRYSDSNTLINGLMYDNGSQIGVGTTNPLYTFDVNGDIRGTNIRGTAMIVGGTSLAASSSNRGSGAFLIGAYDEFTNSNSTNVQFVLKDLDTALNNLAGGTAAFALAGQTHPALQLAGTATYLSLNGSQVLTQGAIDLTSTSNTTGALLTSRGGLGVDASTAPAGTLAIGNGTGFSIRAMGGDATIASNGTLALATVNPDTGTYGSALGIPVFQVDGKGRIISASTVPANFEQTLTFSNPLSRSGNTISLDVTTTGTTSTTASNSGLEIGSDGLRLLGGCALNEVLAWDAGANRWRCSSVSGVGALTGSGSNGQVTFWGGSSSLTGTDSFFWSNGTASLGLGTTNPGARLAITPANAAALLINAYGSGAGNTGELRFSELRANGTNYTGFKAPDSLAQDIVYTLPSATGPADYVLTFQNNGLLEWKEITGVGSAGDITAVGSMTSGSVFSGASADNQWLGLGGAAGRIEFDDQATDEVNVLDARLGVGTSTPQYALDVNGDINGSNVRGSAFIVGGTSLASTSSNRGSGAFMIGVNDEFNYSNSTNVQAVLRDFDTQLGSLGAGATHPNLQLAGTATYLALNGTQVLTQNAIDLTSTNNTTGALLTSRGGLGVDASTAPAGTLVIGTGTGFNIRAMGGDATIASNGTLTLANSGVTAATYGSGNGIPVIQIDAKGRIISASTALANFEQTLSFSNPLTRSGNTISLDVTTTGTTSTTASNSGLEVGSDGLRLLGGCATNEVLAWDAGANRWRCSSVNGVGGIDGSGLGNYVARWSDANTLTTGVLYDNGTNVGIGTTNPTYRLDVQGGSLRVQDTYNPTIAMFATYMWNTPVLSFGVNYAGDTNPFGQIASGYETNIFSRNDLKIGTYQNNDISFVTNTGTGAQERMIIKEDGRVGIGMTNPTYTLDVAGDVRGTNLRASALIVGGTSLASTSSNRGSGAFMIGAFDEFTNSNSTNVQFVLKDLDTALSNIAGGTGAYALAGQTHPALQLAGTATYLSLNGSQVLTQSAIDLTSTSNTTGALLTSRGGLGVDASTAPAGTLAIGTGTGFNIRAMGGDATIASNGTLTLANSGVTAATYGSALGIPVIQIDAKGRIISASTALANFEQTLSFSNPITRSGNTISLDVTTTSSTSTTASNSGLEIGSDGLRLLGGCASNEVLAWDAGANRWRCSSVNGVGGIDGSGIANYVARWSDANTLTTGALYDNGTSVGIGTTNPLATLSLGPTIGDKLALYDDSTPSGFYGLGIGSNRIFVKASTGGEILNVMGTGYVGIGTTNPLYTLDVAGDVRGTNLRASALIVGGTSLASTSSNRGSGAFMIGAFDEFTYSANTNVQGVLKDLDTALVNIAGGTGAYALAGQTHPALQLAGTASYLSLNGSQVLTQSAINLSTAANTAGVLLSSRGGLGVDASTAPAGTLAIGNGTGFSIRAMGGDATIASNGTLALSNTGVTAATYGSTLGIPVLQISSTGRIISASTALANFEQTLSFSNPLTRSGNTISLDVTTTGTTGTTASNSGLEIGSDGLRLLGGCAANEVLAWDAGANRWRCSTINGVGGIDGSGTTNYVARWTDANSLGTGALLDDGTHVGIGVTAATGTLTLAENSSILFKGGYDTTLSSATAWEDKFKVSTSLVNALNITNGGYDFLMFPESTGLTAAVVGIGTTNPIDTARFVIDNNERAYYGGGSTYYQEYVNDRGGTLWAESNATSIGLYLTGNGNMTYGSGTGNRRYGIYVDNLTGANNNYGAYFANRVGIGNSAPTFMLDVTGNLRATTASLSQLAIGGEQFGDLVGQGLILSGTALTVDVTTTGTTSVTASNSGLELTAAGVRMLGGCSNGQLLTWVSAHNAWECTTSPSSSLFTDAGGTTYLTSTSDSLALGGTTASNAPFYFSVPNQALTLTSTGTADIFRINDQANDTTPFLVTADGYVGVGNTTPQASLHVINTTEQLRLGYNATNYSSFTVGSNGDLTLSVNGVNTARFGSVNNEIYLPTTFSSAGDVSFAYDALFTNTQSSQIKSYGPFAIEAGENFNSDNLTLRTFNAGNVALDLTGTGSLFLTGGNTSSTSIIFDSRTSGETDFWAGVIINNDATDNDIFSIGDGLTRGSNSFLSINTNGYVGIGTTNPTYNLEVNGNIRGTTAALSYLNMGGEMIGELAGQGLVTSGTALTVDVTTTGTTSTTASNSGLELTAGGVRMMGGCSDNQVLAWDASLQMWKCATGASSGLFTDGGATTYLTSLSDSFAIGGTTASNAPFFYDTTRQSLTLTSSTTAPIFRINDQANDTTPFLVDANGLVGIGNTNPLASLHVISTTEQMRLGYDATHYGSFNIGSNGDLTLSINGTQAARFGSANNEFYLPTTFSAAGDVSFAYDILMSNQDASMIKSNGPLTIENGDNYESNNLTLRTFNAGNINMDLGGALMLTNTSPSMIFNSNNALDTDFWAGVVTNNDGFNNDIFAIGNGSTIGTNTRLALNNKGYLGIGTTNPLAALDLMGASTAASSLRVRAGVMPTNPATGDIYNDGSNLYFYNGSQWVSMTNTGTGNLWTDAGGTTYLSSTSDSLALGGTTASDASFFYSVPNQALTLTSTGTADIFRVNDQASDTTPFVINASGLVGIGNSNPQAGLHVIGTTEQMRLGYNATNYTSFTVGSNGDLTLSVNGTNAARFGSVNNEIYLPTTFSAAGDVSFAYDAVFTNQTASKITSNGPFTIEAGDAFENNNLTFKTYGTGNALFNTGGNLVLQDADPTFIFDTTTTGDSDFWAGVVENADSQNNDLFIIGLGNTPAANGLLAISTAGNVGIGTTNPTYKLQVAGTLSATTASFNQIAMGGETVGDFQGNGLIVSGTALQVNVAASGAGASTAAASGLELSSTGLRMLGGCSNGQVLAWDAGANRWQCTNNTTGTSDWTDAGGTTYLTSLSDSLALGGTTASNSAFYFNVANKTFSMGGESIGDFAGNGLVVSGTALQVQLTTALAGASTASNSGLELAASGLRLLGGCSNGQLLAWDAGANRWQCTTSGSTTFTDAGGTTYLTSVSDSFALGGTTASNASFYFSMVNKTLAMGGEAIGDFQGNGLVVSGTALQVRLTTSAAGSSTASNSGLELAASGLRMLGGCAAGQYLGWDAGANRWQCQNYLTDGGATTYLTSLSDSFAIGGSTASNAPFYFSVPNKTLAMGGETIGDFVGQGLVTSGTSLQLRLTASAAGSSTASNSGLELTAAGLRMLGGCSNGQILTWDGGANRWQCTTNTAGTSSWTDAGGTTYLTSTSDSLALGGTTAADSPFYFSAVNQSLTLTSTGTADIFRINDQANDLTPFLVNASGFVGVGTTNPLASLSVISTTEQLRLGYDNNNFSSFTVGSNGDLTLSVNGTNTARFGSANNEFYLPTTFSAAGDVSFANDVLFTNQLSANIKTYGPLTLEVGDNYESNDLTLKTYNAGNVVLDMGGSLVVSNSSPAAVYSSTNTGDTSYWTGVMTNNDGLSNDVFALGKGTIAGTSALASFNSLGQLGIGTTNPIDTIDLESATATLGLTLSRGGVTGRLYNDGNVHLTGGGNLWLDGGNIYMNSGNTYSVSLGSSDPHATFDINGAGTTTGLAFAIKNSADLYTFGIQDNGFTGIGTTAPTFMLDVAGNLRATTASVGQINVGGEAIGDFVGQGLVTSGTSLQVRLSTSAATATTASNSGLELTAAGLRMLGGCSNGQILTWDAGANRWQCTTNTAGTSDWTDGGGTTYLTSLSDSLALGGTTASNAPFYFSVPNQSLTLTSTGTADIFRVNDQSSDLTPFVINAAGLVGIGNTNPVAGLHVIGTTEQMRLGYNATNFSSFTVGTNGDLTISVNGTNSARFGSVNNEFYLPTTFSAAGDASFANNILLSNNAGSQIGTYGPLSIVAGDNYESNNLTLKTYNSGDIVMDMGRALVMTGSAPAEIFDVSSSGDTDFWIGSLTDNDNTSDDKLSIGKGLLSGTSALATLTSDGYLGVGTIVPSVALHVVGNGRFTAVASGTYGNNLNITADGTLTTSTSDIRLKTNIEEMTSTLDRVLKLNPVTFNWKNDPSKLTDIGLIAQEVAPLFPEVTFTNAVDGYMGINYNKFAPILAKAIQELDVKINNVNGDVVNVETLLAGTTEPVMDLQTSVNSLTGEVAGVKDEVSVLRNEIASLKELLGANGETTQSTESTILSDITADIVTETTQSTETTASVAQVIPGDLLTSMQALYDKFVALLENLNISATADSGLLVNSDLNVLGDTTLNNLTVTGDLTAGLMKIDTLSNSIEMMGAPCYNGETQTMNTTICEAQTLYLQKNLAGNVDIMNGAVSITADGTMNVKGTINATTVAAEEFQVKAASKLIGSATIKAGTKEIVVESDKVTADSKIFVTATTQTGSQTLIVSKKETGKSFTVAVENNATNDITFDWWIVTVEQ